MPTPQKRPSMSNQNSYRFFLWVPYRFSRFHATANIRCTPQYILNQRKFWQNLIYVYIYISFQSLRSKARLLLWRLLFSIAPNASLSYSSAVEAPHDRGQIQIVVELEIGRYSMSSTGQVVRYHSKHQQTGWIWISQILWRVYWGINSHPRSESWYGQVGHP